jgi:hypothetical protein
MADGREAPPERPATSASSGPIAARRGRATARCSTPSAPRRRRTSCPGRHALAAARVAPPSRAAARRACGIGREAPGILKAGGAVEVHTMGSAPSAGPHALVLLPTGNARRLERLAGTCDPDVLRRPRHRQPGLLRFDNSRTPRLPLDVGSSAAATDLPRVIRPLPAIRAPTHAGGKAIGSSRRAHAARRAG